MAADGMSFVDRIIGVFSPRAALARMQDRTAAGALMNYNAATRGGRASSFRAVSSDADAATGNRTRLSWVARDMVRNNPFATRAQAVIAGAVVGAGIIPKVRPADGQSRQPAQAVQRLLKRHLETTAIDADGRCNLYGLQRLAVMAVVQDGEVLIRRILRRAPGGSTFGLQIQLLEADYLDVTRDGNLPGGNLIREGIEFDQSGRRVAYWLFDQHPGKTGFVPRLGLSSSRVPASEVIHLFRQDRPGQQRGVTWLAPVALQLQDLMDHQDAQVLRQKIAACFVAFRRRPDDETADEPDPMQVSTLTPGRIQTLQPGEDVTFASPPTVSGFSEFTREVLQSVAAGMGITYAALTGDLSRTNFSSGRLGRIEMDQNVEAWQWLMLIPQFLDPLADWIAQSAANDLPVRPAPFRLEWVPPARIVVDPSREMRAYADMVAAGFVSRQEVIRRLGYDPEDVRRELVDDRDADAAAGLTFTTSPADPAAASDQPDAGDGQDQP
jgi:lambda family phage portal protein